ncbi:hypothetical protein Tco_0339698 [Tanacetum coccineum]
MLVLGGYRMERLFIDCTNKLTVNSNGQMMISLNPMNAIKSLMFSAGRTFGQNSSSLVLHQKMFGQNSSNLVLHLDDVWTKQFKPRSSSYDVCSHQFRPRSSTMDDVWTKQFKPRSSSNDVWTKQFKPRSSSKDVWTKQFRPHCNPIFRQKENVRVSAFILNIEKRNLFGLELLSKHSMFVSSSRWLSYSSVRIQFFKEKESVRFSALYLQKKRNLLRSLLHDNIIPKPDLALELDPVPMPRRRRDSNSGKVHVSRAGSNPGDMYDDILATAYLKVHENLKAHNSMNVMVLEELQKVHSGFYMSLSTKPSSTGQLLHHHTEATTIIIHLSMQIHSISSALQLRVADWSKDVSEEKTLMMLLLKILEQHTADLIEKYSALPGPESIKNQESEKSPKEIIRIKREQGEEKQDSTYSIRNPARYYHLYHALMEALMQMNDAWIRKVAKAQLSKHKALEFEIERLLRAVISQDIMSIVQNPTGVETSDLQTELEYTLDPLSQKLENDVRFTKKTRSPRVLSRIALLVASLFNDKMTSVHISSGLALQRQMASADNTSGPVP